MEKNLSLAERLRPFEAMLTTERRRCVLSGEAAVGYLPIDISGDQDMAVLIDEDDELAEAGSPTDARCGRTGPEVAAVPRLRERPCHLSWSS